MRGKRVGSAQSARGIQLGGSGTAARCGRIPSRDLSPAPAGPRRAHFLRGGAPRPALGRLGKARGEGGSRLSTGRELYSAHGPDLAASRGRGKTQCSLRPLPAGSRASGGTGPPRSRRDCRPGRTVLSAPQPRRVARAGTGPRKRRQGSAAMSATHPTRLETRTKESNARASQRVQLETPWRNESEGRRASAEVGSRPPGAPGAPPARLIRPVGEVERERAR